MKLTGIIVGLVGVVILGFTGLMAMQSDDRTANGTSIVRNAERDRAWPMVIGVGALVAGGLMIAVGGRGYFQSRNLAVRN